jgi:leader peptidase (prepilin peptidase) / N-methyltransferase
MTDLLTGVHPAPAGLLLGAAGAAAGALARWVLGRLRRGARVRAPVCELAVGGAWAVTGGCWAAGFLPPAWVPVLLGLGWLGVAAGCVDLRHHRLPDALTLPALPVALALLLPLGAAAVARGALGAAVALGAHGALHLALPRAMGAGDVKLAGALGAVLAASSWPALVLAAALAAVFTGVAVVAGLAGGRLRRGAGVPHGPSMLLAGWLVSMGGAMGGVLGGPSPHLAGAG